MAPSDPMSEDASDPHPELAEELEMTWEDFRSGKWPAGVKVGAHVRIKLPDRPFSVMPVGTDTRPGAIIYVSDDAPVSGWFILAVVLAILGPAAVFALWLLR